MDDYRYYASSDDIDIDFPYDNEHIEVESLIREYDLDASEELIPMSDSAEPQPHLPAASAPIDPPAAPLVARPSKADPPVRKHAPPGRAVARNVGSAKKKSGAKTTPANKAPAKKAPAKQVAPRKTAPKGNAAQKAPAKKTAATKGAGPTKKAVRPKPAPKTAPGKASKTAAKQARKSATTKRRTR